MLKRGVIVAAAAMLLDQLHKFIMLYVIKMPAAFLDGMPILASGGKVVEVTGFFNFVMVWNYGVSFGMFNSVKQHQSLFLSLLAVGIVILLLKWLRESETKYRAHALGLVIGGALGNVIDRMVYGAVADFFDFHLAGYHWPAFNIADACIFFGVMMLVMESFFDINKRNEKK